MYGCRVFVPSFLIVDFGSTTLFLLTEPGGGWWNFSTKAFAFTRASSSANLSSCRSITSGKASIFSDTFACFNHLLNLKFEAALPFCLVWARFFRGSCWNRYSTLFLAALSFFVGLWQFDLLFLVSGTRLVWPETVVELQCNSGIHNPAQFCLLWHRELGNKFGIMDECPFRNSISRCFRLCFCLHSLLQKVVPHLFFFQVEQGTLSLRLINSL